ncbi:MAG: NDP-sugar synthase [Actinomycetota bacterium]
MKAIILVGGEGTRLRPLTYFSPKQMLPIVGTPMLERVLSNLARHGVSEVVLSMGYLPDKFLEAYPGGEVVGMKISYAVEPERLDTAGAIRFAANFFSINETFIVINGDVITDLDVTALVTLHRERGAQATIALHPVDDPSRFGVVPTHPDNRVIAFVEKPPRGEAPTNEINAGTYVMEPSVLDFIEADKPVSVERVVFPELAERETLFALSDDSYWLDTGTPEAYLQAHRDILSGRRVVDLSPPAAKENWIHPSATVSPSALLHLVTVDRDVVIGEGAILNDVVLMPGCVVAPGARLTSCIIGPGARIGEGSDLGPTCVIGRNEVIAPATQLAGDARVGGPQ